MGNTKSVPSTDRHDPRRPSYERRKLSKPRVGNHGGRRGILCFPVPSAIIGGRVSKAKNGVAQGINGAAPRQQTIQEWTNITDEKTEINTLKSWGPRTRHHSFSHSRHSSISHTRNASLVGSCRHSSLPLARYSSSRKSTLTSQDSKSDREANDLDRIHPPPSIMRRRSQILAAPPATKTRRQPTPALEGGLPVPQLLALNLAETDRAQTPSGYSVLGGFRRGSLRIVNATASPAPSTQDSRPRRRNTSPVHPNASTHSLHMATSTPHLTITSDGNEGYFGYHGKLKIPNTTLNGSPMPGQTHHPETLTPLSFETAPTEVPNANEASELQIHILPPIVDGLKVQRTSTPQGYFFKPSETPKTKASQQKNSPSIHASALLAAHGPHLPLTSHQIAVSLDNSPIARSLSSSSSIYSSTPEHQPAGVNYPQRNAAGRPLAQTGTDSGYCSTGSVSSWSGEAGDGDLQQSCTNCSAGSVGRNSNANHAVSGTNKEQTDTDKRILQPKGLDERPLTFTDNYRIRATLEGPIVEEIVLSGRSRKPSPEIREHILAHKRSFTERLCSAVSSGDLEPTTDQSIFSSMAKQQTLVSTRE